MRAVKGAGEEVDEQQEENAFASASPHLLDLPDSISMTDATLVVEPKIDFMIALIMARGRAHFHLQKFRYWTQIPIDTP